MRDHLFTPHLQFFLLLLPLSLRLLLCPLQQWYGRPHHSPGSAPAGRKKPLTRTVFPVEMLLRRTSLAPTPLERQGIPSRTQFQCYVSRPQYLTGKGGVVVWKLLTNQEAASTRAAKKDLFPIILREKKVGHRTHNYCLHVLHMTKSKVWRNTCYFPFPPFFSRSRQISSTVKAEQTYIKVLRLN